jgi:phospholipase C
MSEHDEIRNTDGSNVSEIWLTRRQSRTPACSAILRFGLIGLGFRVAMLVISPFSRGGFVCSDRFDHTV